jgi:hypothetical protein
LVCIYFALRRNVLIATIRRILWIVNFTTTDKRCSERDSLIPVNSPLLKKRNMSKEEERALIAFLETLSTPVQRIKAPELPQ